MIISSSTTSSRSASRFLRLPVEIRLLIYHKLLTQDLKTPRTFCPHDHQHFRLRDTPDSTIYRSILSTCKSIKDEALPILYTNNTIQLTCDLRDNENPGFGQYPPLWTGIENHHFQRSLGEKTRDLVKNVSIGYDTGYHSNFCNEDEFDMEHHIATFVQSWPMMEELLLRYYPNLETVDLGLRVDHSYPPTPMVHIHLNRQQSQKTEAEDVQDYMAGIEKRLQLFVPVDPSLFPPSSIDCHQRDLKRRLADVRTLAESILISHHQGTLRNAIFRVHEIRFEETYPAFPEDMVDRYPTPSYQPEDIYKTSFFLGCDKYSSSKELIEQILRKPCSATVRLLRDMDNIGDLAGHVQSMSLKV